MYKATTRSPPNRAWNTTANEKTPLKPVVYISSTRKTKHALDVRKQGAKSIPSAPGLASRVAFGEGRGERFLGVRFGCLRLRRRDLSLRAEKYKRAPDRAAFLQAAGADSQKRTQASQNAKAPKKQASKQRTLGGEHESSRPKASKHENTRHCRTQNSPLQLLDWRVKLRLFARGYLIP